MQWDESPNAGFSTAEPWIPLHSDYATLNAALQAKDPASVYSYWSAMLKVRKQYADILVYGSFELVDVENPDVFAFLRLGAVAPQQALVVLKFCAHEVSWSLPLNVLSGAAHVILSNYPGRIETKLIEVTPLSLRPFEALIWLD
jgi:glycosidase